MRLNPAADSPEEEAAGNAEVHPLAVELPVEYLAEMLGAASPADPKVTPAMTIARAICILQE